MLLSRTSFSLLFDLLGESLHDDHRHTDDGTDRRT
jgi:hypothetical protein